MRLKEIICIKLWTRLSAIIGIQSNQCQLEPSLIFHKYKECCRTFFEVWGVSYNLLWGGKQ